MKLIIKNKSLTIIMLLLGLLTLVGGNLYLLASNGKLLSTAQDDTSVLSVQKVLREVDHADSDVSDGYTYEDNTLSAGTYQPIIDINNNDFAMLNNNFTDNELTGGELEDNVFVENILISFANNEEGDYLPWLTASAWLNGTPIDISSAIKTKEGTEEDRIFLHSLDLKTLTDAEGQPFDSLEGHYEYRFNYFYKDSSGLSYGEFTKSIEFWLIDENNYINITGQENIIPKMYNTEKIDRMEYDDYIEENYFNFNNFASSETYGAGDGLLFPTLVYDASRYNLSYVKDLYGVKTTVTSDFKIIDGVGQVSFYLNDELEPFKQDNITPVSQGGKDYYIYDGLKISDVGDYDFTVSYTFKVSNDEFVVAQNDSVYQARILDTGNDEIDYASNVRDNNVELYVFGYQAYYSEGNVDDAEFKTQDNSIVSDYTNSATVTNSDPEQNFALDYITAYNLDKEGFTFPRIPEDLTIPVLSSEVASTNQAPVFLKSYGSLKYNSTYTASRSFYYFYPTGTKTGTPEIFSYTNNTRFTQNGYYEVAVIYDFQKYKILDTEVEGRSEDLHMQVFAFKIANLPPTVSITTNTGSNITSGKYTNADSVSATWNSGSVFDVNPHARVWRQGFNGFNPYTQADDFNATAVYDNVDGEVYEKDTPITTNGHYTLQVFYGPSTNTSIIYKFTRDQSNISGFTVIGAKSSLDGNDNLIYEKETNLNLTNQTVVNTPFALNWNQKPSGATINAKYSFTSISKQAAYTPEVIMDGNDEWVTNGYETLDTFSNLTYNRTTTTGNVLNANSVLTNSSIYIFTLTDQAGNSFDYYVVLDNTKAEIIQTPPPVSKYNFVPEQTTLTWGTHKAIEVTDQTRLQAITTGNELFKEYNEKLYLLVPIDSVKVYGVPLDEFNNLTVASGQDFPSISPVATYTKDNNFESSVTFYTGLEPDIPSGNEQFTGEKIYHTYVIDSSNISPRTNIGYKNIKMLDLQVNLDRSQGYAEMQGTVKGLTNNNETFLPLNAASNKQYLYFNYKDASDDYQIESLTYTFYPLTFDESSPNYPFDSVASKEEENLLTNAELVEGDLYKTAKINTTFSTKYNKEITVPGMYVITRTYVGNISEEETGDTKVKTYTYYVDRYNIIEELDDLLIGEHIKLILGEVAGRTPVVFDDFLIVTTKPTLIETNLLPVAIQIPQNKYSLYDEYTATYSEGISSFDLSVSLLRKYTNSSGNYETETIQALDIVDGLIILPQLYKNGIYEVLIKDKTGYGVALIDSNEFSFSFEIKNNRPDGDFYGTPHNDQEIQLVNIDSTNETTLKFIWTDPEDIYSAKVDAGNIEIKQNLKGTTGQSVIYKVVDGDVTINPYNLSITEVNIGTLIGSDGTIPRKQYLLPIFTPESPLAQVEATYFVNIQYEGLEEHYVYDNNNFFTNSIDITIDRTAPEYNLNRLITQDTYLSSEQKANIKDNSESVNTENYAFAVNSAFTFVEADIPFPAQDTHLIYYREYDKYSAGQANLQSLIPGDEYYDNYEVEPTRPRFNTANNMYISMNYNTGNFASIAGASGGEYYEIIEIDEAGNHTVYTIQVLLNSPSIEGRIIFGTEEDAEYETFTRNNNMQENIDALNLEIDRVVSTDKWYTLKIKNNATDITTTLNHTPNTDEQAFITDINSLIMHTEQSQINGASYQFTLTNRINKNINFSYNAQGNVLEPSFEDYENSFIITLPEDTLSTNITSFIVYKAINGVLEENDDYRVYYDMNGVSINADGVSGASYELEAGEYAFRFVDNFERIYSLPKIFGLEDVLEVFFEGTTITLNEILYTADDVKIVYQKELYTLDIFKNGGLYSVSAENITTNSETGIREVWLKDIAAQTNLIDDYVITLTNSAGNETNYEFTVYTVSPELTLTDSLDNDLTEDVVGYSTTKPVYISYENTTMFAYDVRLEITVLDEDNNASTIVHNSIDPLFAYNMPGIYQLTFYNILGTNVVYNWSIQETATVIYSVIENINGLERPLSVAETKYSYLEQDIDQYFTIHSYRIDKNPDRDLTIELIYPEGVTEISEVPVGETAVFEISGSYSRLFAVTRMPTTTSFLSDNFTINSYLYTNTSRRTSVNPTLLEWNAFNNLPGNYIYAEYYFNSQYVGRIYENSVELEDAGVYTFIFKDFAGNTQLFDTEDSYRILLLDEVLFSINNADPIDNVIYNEPVSLNIEHISEYDYRTLSLSATLNGYPITPLKVNDAYVFSEYGLYNITLTAEVTIANEPEAKTINSYYSFMLLNKNEAKLSFEYSPQTGYEIISIVKDGINVTDDFKEAYNSNTLTRLFLSPDEGGNGNYTVTVSANYLTLKPSQVFEFDVWVNNEKPVILSSIKQGATTTKNIMLTFNKYLIYQQIGNSVIKINDEETIVINAETSSTNQITNYELASNATYLVQLQTDTGNTVLSFKLVKKAPLNSVAIFLIIAAVLTVSFLTIVFIRLRTRMKVS
jgi:hypothetical protein